MNWDFREVNTKHATHGFHTYPAMLVPQIAEELISLYGKRAELLFDPFCGTGTTLVEANLKGINAIGTDINPLARLISRAKTTMIKQQTLDLYLKDFYDYLFAFRLGFTKKDSVVIPKFTNIQFWFSRNVIADLAVIKKYINGLKEETIKDFFKVVFSQTIRECSLTRKNEFKLYKMDKEKLKTFKPDVFSIFEKVLARNRNALIEYSKQKASKAYSDVKDFNSVHCIPKEILGAHSVNLIITSPPYGDSQTTVAYGQFSRLANQWLDCGEAYNLDSKLMGGRKAEMLETFSCPTLDRSISRLKNLDVGRCKDVISFYKDYRRSIINTSKVLKRKGIACYIVSNRCVKGVTLRTDRITQDFFEQVGLTHIETIERRISNKRMPRKNSPGGVAGETKALMNKEYIVVMQKK
ncbi:MAG TPA: DNA methyltransferase [Paenisporosarcina sp.]|nr:DNA methyltransferase [Paenisporosarcina sp.]